MEVKIKQLTEMHLGENQRTRWLNRNRGHVPFQQQRYRRGMFSVLPRKPTDKQVRTKQPLHPAKVCKGLGRHWMNIGMRHS